MYVYRRPFDYAVHQRRRFHHGLAGSNQNPIWNFDDPDLATGTPYLQNLNDVCSDPNGQPMSYSIVSGSLPGGVSLGGSVVQGSPTGAGTFNVTFRADDGIGTTDEAVTFTVTTDAVFVYIHPQLTVRHV